METIRNKCKENNIYEHEMQGIINISIQNKWCYIENAKVGCSSIKYNLMQLEFENSGLRKQKYEDINPKLLHEPMFGPMLHPFQVEEKTLKEIFEEKKYFVFTFVRNPFARVLSAYLDKIEKNKAPKIHIVRSLFKSDELDKPVSFKEFVKLLHMNNKVLYIDKHWRPQTANLVVPEIKYDFIGRLENFDEDFQEVEKEIKRKGEPSKKRKVKNYTPHQTSANEKIRHYYDEETIELIREIYADDFKNFQYDDSISLNSL